MRTVTQMAHFHARSIHVPCPWSVDQEIGRRSVVGSRQARPCLAAAGTDALDLLEHVESRRGAATLADGTVTAHDLELVEVLAKALGVVVAAAHLRGDLVHAGAL